LRAAVANRSLRPTPEFSHGKTDGNVPTPPSFLRPRTEVSRVSPQRERRRKASHEPKESIRGRFRAAAARTSTIPVRTALAPPGSVAASAGSAEMLPAVSPGVAGALGALVPAEQRESAKRIPHGILAETCARRSGRFRAGVRSKALHTGRASLFQAGARSGAADDGRLVDAVDAPDLGERNGVEEGGLADTGEVDGVFGPDDVSSLPHAGCDGTCAVLCIRELR
jgi:hypothetical protein